MSGYKDNKELELTVLVDVALVEVEVVEVLVDVVLVDVVDVPALAAEPPLFWSGSCPALATAPWSPPPRTGSWRTLTIRFARATRRWTAASSYPQMLASADEIAKRNEMVKRSVKTSGLDANMAGRGRAR